MTQCLAAIDIGTNSVLLTIAARQDDGSLKTLAEKSQITRIGQGLGTRQTLLPEAMERNVRALAHYAGLCRDFEAEKILVVGTAALRKATNVGTFIAQVADECGLDIDVISGEREAALAFRAAAHDFGEACLALDIGGGSTEFIWRATAQQHITSCSLPIGSVVLDEQYCHSDPVSEDDFARLRDVVHTTIATAHAPRTGSGLVQVPIKPTPLVALAGTATTLAAMHLELEQYSHDEVHGMVLDTQDVSRLQNRLLPLSVADRKRVRGLEPDRADVILAGTVILSEAMHILGYQQVTISDRGVRWGLLYEAFAL